MDLNKMLLRVMDSRGLSRAGLAYALGYKSATSVARVMAGTGGPESTGAFLQKMLSCEALELTPEERLQLVACLDSRDLGEENEDLYQAFGDLLGSRDQSPGVSHVRSAREKWADNVPPGYETIDITLINCLEEELILGFRRGMDRLRIPVRTDHYILSGQSLAEMARSVKALLPMLHRNDYRCMIVNMPEGEGQKGIYGADGALITLGYPGGRKKQYLILLYGKEDFRVVEPSGHMDPGELLGPAKSIRQVNGEALPRPDEGLLQYMLFCCDLEHNHAVYQIKPCFGMEQVPTDIVIRAGLDARGDIPEYLKAIDHILRRRERNLLSKKRPQYHVYKQSDMQRFVRTGQMTDHPAMLRPFTPGERMEILKRLEERQRNNPYFHLFFFREDDAWVNDEVTLYQDKGLSIIKPGTDYAPEGSHNETLVVEPKDFLEAYKAFYLNRLIRTRCADREGSARILRGLIDEAEALCREGG